MRTLASAAALIVAGLLAGCAGDMTLGPGSETAATEMTAPNPMTEGEIDDATGNQIP